MKEGWSGLAAVIVLGQVIGLIVYEIFALRRPGDSFPTITSMTMAAIKRNWWIGVVILGTLGWLIAHFIRRWIRL